MLIVLSGCTLTDGVQPSPPNPLTVEFLYPLDNTSVLEGTDLQIRVLAQVAAQVAAQDAAQDANGGVARVELRVDDLLHQQGSPVERESVEVFTVEMNWIAQGVGLHALTATAFRLDGTSGTPVTIRVNVIAAE